MEIVCIEKLREYFGTECWSETGRCCVTSLLYLPIEELALGDYEHDDPSNLGFFSSEQEEMELVTYRLTADITMNSF